MHYVDKPNRSLQRGRGWKRIDNLWSQSTKLRWNVATKDKLETYVNREVCAGRMTLKEGQSVFQKGWVEVFHLY